MMVDQAAALLGGTVGAACMLRVDTDRWTDRSTLLVWACRRGYDTLAALQRGAFGDCCHCTVG